MSGGGTSSAALEGGAAARGLGDSKPSACPLDCLPEKSPQPSLVLLALPVCRSYGFSTIQPELQPAGVSVYEQAKARCPFYNMQ